ncbi:hypothetical protein HNP90_000468 [Methanococcus maripaludis]|uniref:Uncharacterized protein n=1 Tax=Methanococcus maripaludis TaxID=39152 RepID=A0A7J9PFR4_METMI|nr:hypothetical protein [Methanococcus maripaludis]
MKNMDESLKIAIPISILALIGFYLTGGFHTF